MKAPILRIFIALFLWGTSAGIKAQVDIQDSLALIAIRNNSYTNYYQIWDVNTPVSHWPGITVTGNRVTKIQLPTQHIGGRIAPAIGNLTALTVLNLRNNGIYDTIPASIGNLTQLTDINLGQNALTGRIPASIGNLSTLHTLYLNDNKLTDSIPATIFNLAYNTQLEFQNNNFNFSGLEGIGDHFLFPKYAPQGKVNLTVNDDASLYTVYAGGDPNKNTYKWYKNGALYTIKHGDYTLSVPASDSDNYYVAVSNSAVPVLTLQSIEMPWYLDSTSVAYEIHHGGATVYRKRVVGLYIHINTFDNINFPRSICNLSALKYLSITGTYDNFKNYGLNGDIPDEIANLKKLTRLDLSTNNLTSLPPAIGKLTNLTYLNVSSNQLSSIQPAIGKLTNLQTLILNDNATPGAIPDSLKYLSSLTELDLHGNSFTTGLLPLCSLTNLRKLNLSLNSHFTDTIPAAFANLTKLEELFMAYNRSQSGGIAPLADLVSLKNLTISESHFTGPIPRNIGNLTNLVYADLRDNMFSDSIPSSIGQLKNLQSLVLSSNNLSGKIPATIANLTNLTDFEIENNNLSGYNIVLCPILPYIVNNRFTFEAAEPFVTKFGDNQSYYPQQRIPLYRDGNTIYVRAGGKLANNTYRLYKDGYLLDGHMKDSSFIISDTGTYYIKINNKIAKKLVLLSDEIHISSLPVTMLNFTASLAKTDVQLNWQTAQEINTGNFTVERSLNGNTFAAIGKVLATGNSQTTHYYNYVDYNATALSTVKLYYRLKITDKDGSYSYSKIISLANDDVNKSFAVYPNPAHIYATVQFNAASAGKYNIKVIAANGKVVTRINITATAGSNRAVINTAGLPTGSYLVTITGEKESKTLTLVKE